MTIETTDLSQLSAAEVQQQYDLLTQFMQEQHPEIELTRGPFADTVLLTSSELGVVPQRNMQRLQASLSLQAIIADPTLADNDIVDATLSNHNVTRRDGAPAAGSVTIVVTQNVTTVIAAGAVFTASGEQFTTQSSYAGRPAGAGLTSPTDRTLLDLGNGTFAMTIDVLAVVPGPAGNITQGTKLSLDVPPIYFSTAYAAGDFSGGFDTETNTQLIARLQNGDAAAISAGSVNYAAWITSQPDLTRIQALSFVGIGKAEMTRDRHWIWPISGGGCIDVYARTQAKPIGLSVVVTATLISTNLWQFALTKDILPGFYYIESIQDLSGTPGSGSYPITREVRGYDLTGVVQPPEIADVFEAVYTTYQTAVVSFTDDRTAAATAVGASRSVKVTLRGMSQIAEIQSLFTTESTRPLDADVLVKAAVPCLVSVGIEIRKLANTADPDTTALQNAVADAVNQLPFGQALYGSLIDSTVTALLPDRQAVGRIELYGKILAPTGETRYIHDTRVLTIPDEAGRLVTPRTTAFLLNPADVSITVLTQG